MKFLILPLFIVATVSVSCAKKGNPRVEAPPEVHVTRNQAAPKVESAGDPKVNILFVVDNSQSMDAHQAKLKANIDRFADKFFDNPRIDYKIGVVPVFDRVYLNDTKKDYTYYETINGRRVTRVGPRKMNPYGELVSLKGANGQVLDGAPFITRDTPDAINVLKNTVAIGTQWGPEAEESFSPVLKIISDANLNKTVNGGFYEKNSYLVVIFLTDADDVTAGVSAYEFYEELKSAKGGKSDKILIAAALPGATSNSTNCRLDGRGAASKLPELVNTAQATRADLCSNSFGDALAELGDRLVEKVGAQRIQLPFIPDSNSIQVTYGAKNSKASERQIIPRGETGWSYNVENQEIVLSPELRITRVKDGEIFVDYKEVNLRNLENGRLVVSSGSRPTAAAAKR